MHLLGGNPATVFLYRSKLTNYSKLILFVPHFLPEADRWQKCHVSFQRRLVHYRHLNFYNSVHFKSYKDM